MSNADQLKYMRMQETLDKKPTPIRKKSPTPIIFPKQPVTQEVTQDIPRPEPDTQPLIPFTRTPISVELEAFIQERVDASLHEERRKTREAFDEYSANLYHLLDRSEAEIITMGEAQFQAFMRVVLEDDE